MRKSRYKGGEKRHMFILIGIVAGILGFAPLFLSMGMSRRSTSTSPLSPGLYGLGGVSVSLVILVVALIIVALNFKDQLVFFAASETVVFLGCTIAYFVYRNVRPGTRKRVEKE